MEYTAALEEKVNAQANRIVDIKAIVDGQTVLTNTMDLIPTMRLACALAFSSSAAAYSIAAVILSSVLGGA